MATNTNFKVKNGLTINTTDVFDSDGKLIADSSAGTYANAAFVKSNTADQRAVTSGVYANAAYGQANTADQRAVTSGSYANSAYSQANTATTNAATADQKAVSAGSYANAAYTQANTATTNAATADQKAVSAGSYANSAFTKANNALANTTGTFAGELSVTQTLKLLTQGGDEGGELFLGKAATNTTLDGGVTIDVYQNKLRFFEQGGLARGFYLDLANNAAAGVGTDLGAGATSSDNWARSAANSASSYANSAFSVANTASAKLDQDVKTSSIVTFNSVLTSNNGNGFNYRVGDDAWI